VKRTLVIAPQWIGDAVMAEPLLATLAEGGDRLTVAALPWVAPVFSAMAEVAEIVELPFAHGRLDWAARRRVAAQWRDRFDVAYVLPNSFKSALVPWLARIPERVGYPAGRRWSRSMARSPAPPSTTSGGRVFASSRPCSRTRRRGTACNEVATGPSRRVPNTARPSAGRRRTTRRSRARSTLPTARRSRSSARPAKPICVPRSRRRPGTLAGCSPVARRCSTRSR
jgi:hypothetical protein